MPAAKILVVEDEDAIREMLLLLLEQADFKVECAGDAHKAQAMLAERTPDLVLLDWMLPGLSGVEWARRLKRDEKFKGFPVIMLSARGEEEDKIRGFDVGADDYMTKPFSPKELIARIKAVLRRSLKAGLSERIQAGDIVLLTDQHRVMVRNAAVEVSPTEYRLLEIFLTHPDKVYSRTQLLDQVWGRSSFIEERTVDVHIRRLRKILQDHERDGVIHTVRGFGYRFSESP